ncbi:MobQ family relaxase [Acinetobacter ursingii]|uniref:MobQ family relaxase n=1 Tax=Acinetobacter ursingii TaxID=108980 RepID=UPI0021CD809B|nr:MobQ family relaxase [Acinetobacter ursingii]MCU4524829.1 MobA/MobL family protein [Acinetobacter ursingii]
MAIYHFSVKAISRSDGRSAVACAAYRSGEKLVCDYYGKEQDYTKKTGVEFTNIYAPENTKKELLDRNKLWNAVEKVENRKNSLLAREFEIAFPSELNAEQRKTLLDELCQELVKRHGVIVDAAIHAPHTEGGSDDRNYHAHIMFTTRSISKTGDFESKKYRDFSRDDGTKTVSQWRSDFADLVNNQLEAIGSKERVSHLSYEELGNGLEATKHEGYVVTQLRRLGIDTEISLANDEIKQRNAEKIRNEQVITGLDQEITVSERLICDLREEKSEYDRKQAETQKAATIAAQRKIEHDREQAKQLDRDKFLQLQDRYKNFADSYFITINNKNQSLNDISEQLERSKKWLSKQRDVYEREGIFYHAMTHDMISINTPEYWLSSVQFDRKKKEIERQYQTQIIELISDSNIEIVVRDLRETAAKILGRGEDLPVNHQEKQTFFKKLFAKKEYVHSYETLSDYDEHVVPVLKKIEIRQELIERQKEKQLEREKLDEIEKKRYEQEVRQIKLENEKRYESERNQRYQSQRDFETEQPKPRPKNDFEI